MAIAIPVEAMTMGATMAAYPCPPTPHRRILQASLTGEGQRRLEAATPAVRQLEAAIEDGFTPGEIAAIKTWLVRAAQRMEHVSAAQRA
jgi:DNA-binding MarR family transcriptional regulator